MLLLLLLGKSPFRGELEGNPLLVMLECDILVLYLLTLSSIILVYLTLRLHFEAHYRRRWSQRGTVKLQTALQSTNTEEEEEEAGVAMFG